MELNDDVAVKKLTHTYDVVTITNYYSNCLSYFFVLTQLNRVGYITVVNNDFEAVFLFN